MTPENEDSAVGGLRELAELHTIRYETRPEYEIVQGKRRAIGFSLDLYGTHDHGESSLAPGCAECVRTFEDMKTIAESLLPTGDRTSQYEIFPSIMR